MILRLYPHINVKVCIGLIKNDLIAKHFWNSKFKFIWTALSLKNYFAFLSITFTLQDVFYAETTILKSELVYTLYRPIEYIYIMAFFPGFEANFMDDVGQTLLNWVSAFGTQEMVIIQFKLFKKNFRIDIV